MTALLKLSEPLAKVNSTDQPWEVLGTHGLRRKVMGLDASSGHVTFLLDIPKGWHGGGVAHFHHGFEEVLMLEGSVTLDGEHYWHAGDYFYRPAYVVHGLKESSEEGAKALVRCDRPMELLLVPEPELPTEYSLPECNDPRGHLFQVRVDDAPVSGKDNLPPEWRVQTLSADPESGARTLMITIAPGWSGDAATPPNADWEAFMLDGTIETNSTGETNAASFAKGDYTVGDAQTSPFSATASSKGARFILWLFETV